MIKVSFEAISSEKHSISPVYEPRKNLKDRRISLKTGLTKKQKVTELYFNEKDAITEVYTHNTALKKRLTAYKPF